MNSLTSIVALSAMDRGTATIPENTYRSHSLLSVSKGMGLGKMLSEKQKLVGAPSVDARP